MFNWVPDIITSIPRNILSFFYNGEEVEQNISLQIAPIPQIIEEKFFCPPGQEQQISIGLLKQISPYIGTIDNGFHSGMGCLLNDGTFLTALHTIYDFKTGKYRPLELITITFLKDGRLYHYKIEDIIHDGTAALHAVPRGGPSTYDYARLRLNRNPLEDLGVGLIVDTTDYFGQTLSNPKPSVLLSISALVLERTTTGELVAKRYVSISRNKSSDSGFYTFPVISNYFRNQGFSGQAIFPFADSRFSPNTLYAVHEGYDENSNEAIGFECSEYHSQVKFCREVRFWPGVKPHAFFGFIPEVLTKENIKDLEEFLDLLKICISTKKPIDKKLIPSSLMKSNILQDYQKVHTTNGRIASKTIINPHILTNHTSDVMIALCNMMDMLTRHYYRKNRKIIAARYSQITGETIPVFFQGNHARQEAINDYARRSHAFYKKVVSSFKIIIDLEYCISDIDRETENPATAFYIDGFTGDTFHIVPVDPCNPNLRTNFNCFSTVSDIMLNAKDNLEKTAASRSSTSFGMRR